MPLQNALEFSKTEGKKGAQYYIQLGRLFSGPLLQRRRVGWMGDILDCKSLGIWYYKVGSR